MKINKDNFTRKIPSGAIIFNDNGEILMCKRISKKDFWNNKWEFPGGTIEFGEDPKNTAIRETKEEAGVDIKLLSEFPIVMNYSDKQANEDYICLGFPAKYVQGEINVNQDDSVSDAKWFKYSDIDFNSCLPFTKEMIDIAIQYIK